MRLSILLLLIAALPVAAESPNYDKAYKELPIAWERLYPLPFQKITKTDPLKKGIQLQKRKDNRKVWVFNFNVFMTKYDLVENLPVPREEGREILVFFLWEPGNLEEPYRIHLGEWNENL
ncbi:hypothetical protein [Leptospira idonii]|uniref:Acetylxylan esterase n=1 Tax=Leptospira idonii TaxID=1193500 RepID=A0A4R9M4I1_9LEPT|nr:hypothetical protein [Leptospira idonii]TGN19658.1 hypothetical protein EHS15_07720 [Leptospira idonii]